MAFGWAGAAEGATDTLEGMLAARRAEALKNQELALRQQQMQQDQARAAAELALRQQEQARLARTQQLAEAQATLTQLDAQGQGAPVSSDAAATLKGTPFATRLQTQPTLAATSMAGDPSVGMQKTPLPSVDLTTLRPTQAQIEGAGQREGQRRVVDLLRRGAPRNQILGALAEGGENITGALLNDPADAARIRAEAEAARAADANQTRLLVAGMAAQGKNETTALRNDLLRTQIDAATQKQQDAATAQKAKDEGAAQYANDIASTVRDLIDERGQLRPDVAGIVGAWDGATPNITESANTAAAKVDRLIALLDINKLREMKAQSKTGASGFGALSQKELGILESAGSTLRNRRQSEAAYAAELQRVLQTIAKANALQATPAAPVQPQAPAAPAGGGYGLTYQDYLNRKK